MDFFKLDNELKFITSEEMITDLSDYYNSLKRKIMDGKTIYIFDSIIPENKDFHIAKHDRFLRVPMHIHTFIELNYVYAGKCSQIIDGKTITLERGEICIIDTEVPHSILETTEKDIIINVLVRKDYFNVNFLKNLSNNGIIFDFLINAFLYTQTHNQYIIFHSSDNHHIPLLFQQILWETYYPSLCSYQMIENYLNLLFLDLVRVFEYDTNKKIEGAKTQHSIIEIIKYIEANYLSCNLASIAKHFNYTPNYLSTLIKENTKKNFSDLIMVLKLNQTSFLLINMNTPVYDIARECGFSNLTFFFKKFKKHFGMTPNEYRQKNII